MPSKRTNDDCVAERVGDRRVAVTGTRPRPGTRCGALVIDSWPPAATTAASPSLTLRAASITAVSPERQVLLIVVAGTS